MRLTTRCREYRHGLRGRIHSYQCRNCGGTFSRLLLRALPEKARLCDDCMKIPELIAQSERAFEERDRKENLTVD